MRGLSKTIYGVALILCVAACGGGSDSTAPVVPTTIAASFGSSGTVLAPDLVRLTGAVSGDTVTVNVVIGGVTASNDLYSFAFDLVIGDTGVAQYVDGSIAFGSALKLSGSQGSSALASQVGDRVVVGVTKLGAGSGNGVTATEETVVTLRFRVMRRAATTLAFGGSPPDDPEALDSGGQVIGSVEFDMAPATISGS